MKQYLYLLLSSTLILAGCSAGSGSGTEGVSDLPEHIRDLENLTVYPADAEPHYSIELTEETGFGSVDDLTVFINPSSGEDLKVDSQGRVIIADHSKRLFQVFNPDGSHLTTFGREGAGPGEFRFQTEMAISENEFFVYDSGLHRFSIFSLYDFSFVHTILLNPDQWSGIPGLRGLGTDGAMRIVNDNQILLNFTEGYRIDNAFEERIDKFFVMNREGEIVSDEVFSYSAEMHMESNGAWGIRFPFFRDTLVSLARDGRIFSAWTEDLLIKIFDSQGNYLSAFYHPYNKLPLDQKAFIEELENRESPRSPFSYVDLAREMTLPDTWPALEEMIVDDENRVWVSTVNGSESESEWLVFSDKGVLLAQFNWPTNKPIEEIKGSHLYTFERDEIGDGWIKKYRIQLTEN